MTTLRKTRKLAVVSSKTQEEHPGNGQSRNTSVPRSSQENITQVLEKIEGRVARKLSQDFSRTVFRILGALSKVEGFLLNPQIRTFSGIVPGKISNTDVENLEPTGDLSKMILILKWSSLSVSPAFYLTQTQWRPLTA